MLFSKFYLGKGLHLKKKLYDQQPKTTEEGNQEREEAK